MTGIYLEKEIIGSGYGVSGSDVGFVIRIKNYTSGSLKNYRITEEFPAGNDSLRYITGTLAPSNLQNLQNGGDINPRWNQDDVFSGTIDPGDVKELIFTGRVVADENGFDTILNTVKFEVCDDAYGSNCRTPLYATATVLPQPDLEVEKVLVDPLPQADNRQVTYDLIVRNI